MKEKPSHEDSILLLRIIFVENVPRIFLEYIELEIRQIRLVPGV